MFRWPIIFAWAIYLPLCFVAWREAASAVETVGAIEAAWRTKRRTAG